MSRVVRTLRDGVFSARAIFVDTKVLARIDDRARLGIEALSRSYRIVAVTRGGVRAPLDRRITETVLEVEAIAEFGCRHGIELYASWYIGRGPDLGFAGIMAAATARELARAVERIRATEKSSPIIIDYARLAELIASLRRKRVRIVFTNGVFDLVHVGHIRLLAGARSLGDVLFVGINSDDSTRKIKGPSRPIVPQFARAETLVSFQSVDYCCIFTETDPLAILGIVKPDVLAKGSDYSLRRVVGARYVTGYGGQVARLQLVQGCSTTSTIHTVTRHENRLRGKEK